MAKVFNRLAEKSRRRALRNNMPRAEIILWSRLKGKVLKGFKFRRQYSIGKYIVDFYCSELKLAIEVDGDSHYMGNADEYDCNRQAFICSQGVTILRFTNTDIYKNMDGVLEKISGALTKVQPPLTPPC